MTFWLIVLLWTALFASLAGNVGQFLWIRLLKGEVADLRQETINLTTRLREAWNERGILQRKLGHANYETTSGPRGAA